MIDYSAANAAAQQAEAVAQQASLGNAVGKDMLAGAPAGVQAELNGLFGGPAAGATAGAVAAGAEGALPPAAGAGAGEGVIGTLGNARDWLKQRWALMTPQQRLAAQLGGTGVAGMGLGALATSAMSQPQQQTIITR